MNVIELNECTVKSLIKPRRQLIYNNFPETFFKFRCCELILLPYELKYFTQLSSNTQIMQPENDGKVPRNAKNSRRHFERREDSGDDVAKNSTLHRLNGWWMQLLWERKTCRRGRNISFVRQRKNKSIARRSSQWYGGHHHKVMNCSKRNSYTKNSHNTKIYEKVITCNEITNRFKERGNIFAFNVQQRRDQSLKTVSQFAKLLL